MKKIPLLYLALLALVLGCNNSGYDSAVATVALAPDEKVKETAASVEQNLSLPPKLEVSRAHESKIIREGHLRFETDNLETTFEKLSQTIQKFGATVENDTQGKDYNSVSRSLVLRVPSQYFDAFVAAVSQGVGNFDRKEISARDVTEEFIDTEARLKNKKILEARYQELLKKAAKVSEMLEIEEQLSEVRQEIESNENRLKYLQSRISMSPLTVEFYKIVANQTGVTVSYGSKMKNALAEGFYGISSFFLGLLYIWPIILILVALIFVLRKRFRRKKTL